ncbi:MAG: S8 family serine peptidase [Lachnospiraceae bacterium]|nr:S8 family serine peptidase [Lachnospiraceae bacterium]
MVAQRVVNGRVDMWLPDSASLNEDTRFLTPSPETTLTIPSTSNSARSVGGYNSLLMSYADFSGRGFTRVVGRVKPDIVAPAVNITSAAAGGGVTEKSGTSMACPFVAGSAALLMEWGIVRENDSYLYGEKVKAYLIKGARPLPGYTQIPDERIGFGALCLRDSIPI